MTFNVNGKIIATGQVLIVPIDSVKQIDALMQEQEHAKHPLVCEITQERQGRSKTANDKCWALCTDLAKVLSKESPTSKEDVYRRFIRETNYYFIVPIKDEAVETYKRVWGSKGKGWIAEEAYKSKIEGFTTMFSYYGSSEYDSLQMSRFIDMIIEECKLQGVETDPAEIARLKEEWGKA